MNALVLLAGCGLGDGSCVEEVILTYTVLDKYGHSYAIAAVDMDVPSVDHRTEAPGPERNVLTESARIGRDLLLEEAAQLSPRGFCRDAAKNIYYTPAFRKSQSCYDVLLGIDGMVSAMASLRP